MAIHQLSRVEDTSTFELRIVGFLCNWCSYSGADAAGRAQADVPSNVKADGVMVLGCHPGDCHYKDGNYAALRRVALLQKMLRQFGLEDGRLRLDWVSAGEADKFARVTAEMVETVRALGPLRLPDLPDLPLPELARSAS